MPKHDHWSDDHCDFCRLTVEEKREEVFKTAEDLVVDFLYYDRKEDENLPREAIEEMIEDGDLTAEELVVFIAAKFAAALGV